MKEKILYVELPEDGKYRKTIVTGDGKTVGIVYMMKNQSANKIRKPEKLIGGTEVYQKERIPYWYCKIKDGRDEFMFLDMEDLTEDDVYYDFKSGKVREFVTREEWEFRDKVLKALENKPEEGYRWIPTFEPSSDGNGGLQFVKGQKPLVGLDCIEWEELMKNYSPENESALSSINTYFLLTLRWLKDGIATLEKLVDNSTEIGHYWNSKNAKHDFELTGEREFGGLYGFVGNTYKLVIDQNSKSRFSKLGSEYYNFGDEYCLTHLEYVKATEKRTGSVGLLELKK